MLFRIWFLYVCKLGLAGFALLVVGFIAPGISPFPETLRNVGLGIVIPICLTGFILGLTLLFKPDVLACPICAGKSTFLVLQRKPSVECDRCGLVSCRSVGFSLMLDVERDEDTSRESPTVSNSSKLRKFSTSVVFLALGMFFWWGMFWSPLLNSQSARHWVESPCKIIGSDIYIGQKSTYKAKVEFTYQVNGRRYRSARYDFTTLNRPKSRCEFIVNSNPVGSYRQCFYDPNAPEDAVITRECDFSLAGLLFPLIFILVGFAAIVSAFKAN